MVTAAPTSLAGYAYEWRTTVATRVAEANGPAGLHAAAIRSAVAQAREALLVPTERPAVTVEHRPALSSVEVVVRFPVRALDDRPACRTCRTEPAVDALDQCVRCTTAAAFAAAPAPADDGSWCGYRGDTASGAQQHRTRGERPCRSCLDAEAAYKRRRRSAKNTAPTTEERVPCPSV